MESHSISPLVFRHSWANQPFLYLLLPDILTLITLNSLSWLDMEIVLISQFLSSATFLRLLSHSNGNVPAPFSLRRLCLMNKAVQSRPMALFPTPFAQRQAFVMKTMRFEMHCIVDEILSSKLLYRDPYKGYDSPLSNP